VRGLVSQKAAGVAQQMRDAVKGGTPLESVAQSSGLKLERIPSFRLVEKPLETDKEKLTEEAAKDAAAKDATTEAVAPKDVTATDTTPKDETEEDVTPKDA